jgi:GntR family transcriptional repressor for pyruvate dehydrogenase complex
LKREYLHQQIADKIQRMIAQNQLQPGNQLPSERELAKVFGASRPTVREAIRLLEQRGLLEMKLGSGSYVTEVQGTVLADSIDRYLTLGTSSHEEFLAFREMWEPEVAALAATCAEAEDLAKLERLAGQADAMEASGDTESYAAADASFHLALAEATHNRLFTAIGNGIHNVMKEWVRAQVAVRRRAEAAIGHHPAIDADEGENPGQASLRHRAVYEAVVARDPAGAKEAMRAHIDFARQTFIHTADEVRDEMRRRQEEPAA